MWTDLFNDYSDAWGLVHAKKDSKNDGESVSICSCQLHILERTWCVGPACSMHRPCVKCLLKLLVAYVFCDLRLCYAEVHVTM